MLDYDHLPVPSLDDCLKAASDTKLLLNAENALEAAPRLLRQAFSPDPSTTSDMASDCPPVYYIADENTWAAAGDRLEAICQAAGITSAGRYLFPGKPTLHAEYHYVGDLVTALRAALDTFKPALTAAQTPVKAAALVPVAVGAGTINDLVKRAAQELGLSYFCLATAASVDGYTSAGAALLADGFKQTFPCAAPRAVLADRSILKAAPPYLTASGWGDLAGKIIAGSDWIIASYIGDPALGPAKAMEAEAIDPLAWAMTQNGLRSVLTKGAADSDGMIDELFQALALTGFSMQYLKSSRPVSGCEHLFAHCWEMADLQLAGQTPTHGYKVAIGTLIATAFTEVLLADSVAPPPGWVPPTPAQRSAEIDKAFKQSPALAAVKATALAKLPEPSIARLRQEAIADHWPEIRRRVQERLWPYNELRQTLAALGCPIRPEEIGLSRTAAIATAIKAQMLRQRYTALDLAWETGCFPAVLAKIEADNRYCY